MLAVYGWLALSALGLLLAPLTILVLVVHAIRKRRFSRPMWVTIHIHHQRQDPRNRPLNFSEGLPLYFRDHDGAAMPEGGVKVSNGKVILTGATVKHSLSE